MPEGQDSSREWKPFCAALILLLGSALMTGCGLGGSAGEDDPDPVNGRPTGRLFLEGGAPAAFAEVRIIPDTYVPDAVTAKSARARPPYYTTRTDATGTYSVDSVLTGVFNVFGELDGKASFAAAVLVDPSVPVLPPDTLYPAGALSGVVSLRADHDPATSLVVFPGTHFAARPDSSGAFTVTGMPGGGYAIRVPPPAGTTGYLPLAGKATARSGVTSLLPDTLRPVFTGIPLVAGLRAAYDTLAGAARLHWSAVGYAKLYGYAVHRRPKGSSSMRGETIAIVTDTHYTDAVFRKGVTGHLGWEDSLIHDFEYRVSALDLSGNNGGLFGYAAVEAVPPSWIPARMRFQSWDQRRERTLDRDEGKAVLAFDKRARKAVRLEWSLSGRSGTLKRVDFDPPVSLGADTLRYGIPEAAAHTLVFSVRDEAGVEWMDSARLVRNRAPELAGVPAPATAIAASAGFEFQPVAADADGDILEFSALNLPEWMAVDTKTGRIHGASAAKDRGTYRDITLRVSDGSLGDTLPPFDLKVDNNVPGFPDAITAVIIPARDTFALDARGVDPDGDSLAYSIQNKPAWASFDAKTGLLSGVPLNKDAGNYQDILISAADADTVGKRPPLQITVSPVFWLRENPDLVWREGAAVAAWHGKIFVMCGIDAELHLDFNLVEQVDLETRVVTRKAPMPKPMRHCVAHTVGERIYVFGAPSGTPQYQQAYWTQEYDPATDTWKQLAYGTFYPVTSAVADGILYTFPQGVGDKVRAYDPVAEEWIARNSLSRPCAGSAATVGGKIYLAGCTDAPQPMQVYNAAADAWETANPEPDNIRRTTGHVVNWNGKILVMNGITRNGGGDVGNFNLFDPATNTWTPSAGNPVSGPFFTSGGKLYGLNKVFPPTHIELLNFDPR